MSECKGAGEGEEENPVGEHSCPPGGCGREKEKVRLGIHKGEGADRLERDDGCEGKKDGSRVRSCAVEGKEGRVLDELLDADEERNRLAAVQETVVCKHDTSSVV